jgi:MraZ protein
VATKFVGRYEHSLDGKGRLILPHRFRADFDKSALVSKYSEGCLAVWTPVAFDAKVLEMAPLFDGSAQDRNRARAFSVGSAEVDVDGQGRIAVPQYLREFARLTEGSIVLVMGALTHVELWNPDAWAVHEAAGDAMLGAGD